MMKMKNNCEKYENFLLFLRYEMKRRVQIPEKNQENVYKPF